MGIRVKNWVVRVDGTIPTERIIRPPAPWSQRHRVWVYSALLLLGYLIGGLSSCQ